VLFASVLVACGIAIFDWHWNRAYEAKAVILIKKTDSNLSGMMQGGANKASALMIVREQYERYLRLLKSKPFLNFVAERIQSHPDATKFIKNLKLNSRSWVEEIKGWLKFEAANSREENLTERIGIAIGGRLVFSGALMGTIEITIGFPDKLVALGVTQVILDAAVEFLNQSELRELLDSKRYLTLKRDETETLLGDIDKSYLAIDRQSEFPLGTKGMSGGSSLEEFQTAKIRLSENEKMIETIKAQLKERATTGPSPKAANDSMLASLRKELDTLYTKKAGLISEGFAEDSYQIGVIESQIKSARENLTALELRQPAEEEKGETPWTWVNLSHRLKQLNQENLFLSARLDTLEKLLKPNSPTSSPAAQSRKIEYLQKRADLQYLFYSELTKRLFDIDVRRISVENQLVVLEPPSLTTLQRRPGLMRNLLLALFFALVLGVTLAFQIEQSNPFLLDGSDVEALSVRILGYVPDLTPSWGRSQRSKWSQAVLPTGLQRPDSREALVFKHLRTRLLQLIDRAERRVKMITVTSASPDDGKSFVSLNLAVALSKLGKRVLLVDGDLRARRLTATLAPLAEDGLSTHLGPNEELHKAIQPNSLENVDFIPAGVLPDDPSEFFTNPSFAILLKAVAEKYDFVFLDTPPAIQFPDATTVSSVTDATILVGCSGKTRLRSFAAVVEQLSGSAPTLWSVLNRTTGPFTKMSTYGAYMNPPSSRSTKAKAV
jgi:capsular exopolysaccharide synthesis family protein